MSGARAALTALVEATASSQGSSQGSANGGVRRGGRQRKPSQKVLDAERKREAAEREEAAAVARKAAAKRKKKAAAVRREAKAKAAARLAAGGGGAGIGDETPLAAMGPVWTEAEVTALMSGLAEHGAEQMKRIAAAVGTRTRAQCQALYDTHRALFGTGGPLPPTVVHSIIIEAYKNMSAVAKGRSAALLQLSAAKDKGRSGGGGGSSRQRKLFAMSDSDEYSMSDSDATDSESDMDESRDTSMDVSGGGGGDRQLHGGLSDMSRSSDETDSMSEDDVVGIVATFAGSGKRRRGGGGASIVGGGGKGAGGSKRRKGGSSKPLGVPVKQPPRADGVVLTRHVPSSTRGARGTLYTVSQPYNATQRALIADGERMRTRMRRISSAPEKLGAWMMREWFYSDVDRAYFQHNEFQSCLNEFGISHVTALSRVEWNAIRMAIGRPRRFSPKFLDAERERLAAWRQMCLRRYNEQNAMRRLSAEGAGSNAGAANEPNLAPLLTTPLRRATDSTTDPVAYMGYGAELLSQIPLPRQPGKHDMVYALYKGVVHRGIVSQVYNKNTAQAEKDKAKAEEAASLLSLLATPRRQKREAAAAAAAGGGGGSGNVTPIATPTRVPDAQPKELHAADVLMEMAVHMSPVKALRGSAPKTVLGGTPMAAATTTSTTIAAAASPAAAASDASQASQASSVSRSSSVASALGNGVGGLSGISTAASTTTDGSAAAAAFPPSATLPARKKDQYVCEYGILLETGQHAVIDYSCVMSIASLSEPWTPAPNQADTMFLVTYTPNKGALSRQLSDTTAQGSQPRFSEEDLGVVARLMRLLEEKEQLVGALCDLNDQKEKVLTLGNVEGAERAKARRTTAAWVILRLEDINEQMRTSLVDFQAIQMKYGVGQGDMMHLDDLVMASASDAVNTTLSQPPTANPSPTRLPSAHVSSSTAGGGGMQLGTWHSDLAARCRLRASYTVNNQIEKMKQTKPSFRSFYERYSLPGLMTPARSVPGAAPAFGYDELMEINNIMTSYISMLFHIPEISNTLALQHLNKSNAFRGDGKGGDGSSSSGAATTGYSFENPNATLTEQQISLALDAALAQCRPRADTAENRRLFASITASIEEIKQHLQD